MAAFFYPKYIEHITSGDLNWGSNTIKVALLKASHTPNSAHDAYDDVSADVVGTPETLTGKTNTNGQLNADDVVFTALTGLAVGKMVIYKDSGTPSTSYLHCLIDDYDGISFTPDGTNVTIVWPSYIGRP